MQLSIPLPTNFPKEAYAYGLRSSGETHGVVLTKPHVVELILDLAGYLTSRDLTRLRLLEPSCGHGVFLLAAIDRLMQAAKARKVPASTLESAIQSFDIDGDHVEQARSVVARRLQEHQVPNAVATNLASSWVKPADFLLADLRGTFDAVVGNPPYIRIEQVEPALQAEYRQRYTTLYDRADLYVAFIERGLSLLSPKGRLSFICADRWRLNKYGAPLRGLIAKSFHVQAYIDLHSSSPFESEVTAYPSIFSIGREPGHAVMVAKLATGSAEESMRVRGALHTGHATEQSAVEFHTTWFKEDEPWVLTSPEQSQALRQLEKNFMPIEFGGRAHVGIGVATGCDSVYIVDAGVDIEPSRLVPLIKREDIQAGQPIDVGRRVINTFANTGRLIDLEQYPRLAAYLAIHEAQIRKRHVAQKSPSNWYRTIDRVYPDLVSKPKLLIPDIAGSNEVVFDKGRFHPHHNLYFVTSDQWDLEVLGGLLSSRVALFFVWSYAVKMRGGYLRFQAQYLRRIRLPAPEEIPVYIQKKLKAAFRSRDFEKLDQLSLQAYQLADLPEFDFVDTRGR